MYIYSKSLASVACSCNAFSSGVWTSGSEFASGTHECDEPPRVRVQASEPRELSV
jgi:hypothetical protein